MPNPTITLSPELEARLKALRDKPTDLRDTYYVFARDMDLCRCTDCDTGLVFTRAVRSATRRPVKICRVCNMPDWQKDCHTDRHDDTCCSHCRAGFPTCDRCKTWSVGEHYMSWIGDLRVCTECRDEAYSFCNRCDNWYDNDDNHEHNVDCPCTPQVLQFSILANSHGTLVQDQRLHIELPEGHISPEAFDAVIHMLWHEQFSAMQWSADMRTLNPDALSYNDLVETIYSMEPIWQAKRGNFTKRLSAVMHGKGYKLDPGLLSRAGSTIRRHAGNTNSWHVEFTRDLNHPAGHFYNDESCWWGGEAQSLCALKSWGGLAMRTYDTAEVDRSCPSGRAWVQPLNEGLDPTNDVLNAHAYVIYNGYGQLEGYTGARLVAYLTSRTYKQVEVSMDYQYINNDNGFLVADQETCNRTTQITIENFDKHEVVSA